VSCVKFIVVRAIVDIVQWYCAVCGEYCGWSSSRNRAMILCFEWSFWGLQQQWIRCNVTMICVDFILVTVTVDIVQLYYVFVEFLWLKQQKL